MQVLVADSLPIAQLEGLRALGVEVRYEPGLGAQALPLAARDATVLVVRSTEVNAAVFEQARGLSLVVRAGAGVNTIDVKAASARGVYVANCPGQNSIAVAELAWGLILGLDRRIPAGVQSLREGHWRKKEFGKARGLFGRTLGILGAGAIGRQVGRRGLAFGMRVVACSIDLTAAKARELGFDFADDPLALAQQSDVLTVHVPASAVTKGLVSREVLAALHDGALFINTARADVVDQVELLTEARRGRLRIGVDVFAGEPKTGEAEFDSELAKLPDVYGTHHIGASTEQAQDAIAAETVRIIESFLKRGEVPNCVNIAEKTPASWQMIVRHQDRVGVLANVLDLVREAGINVQELENTVFEGANAACCKVQLDARPAEALLERIRASEEIIFVDLVALG